VHFALLLLVLLIAASIHVALMKDRTTPRAAEICLLYILVGYCGVPMLAVSLWALVSPESVAARFGFGPPGPILAFFSYAYLGMALLSLLTLRYRGSFLIGPAVVWAVYFGGATLVHFKESGERAAHSHGAVLATFATHGLITVLLVVGLLASGQLSTRE